MLSSLLIDQSRRSNNLAGSRGRRSKRRHTAYRLPGAAGVEAGFRAPDCLGPVIADTSE